MLSHGIQIKTEGESSQSELRQTMPALASLLTTHASKAPRTAEKRKHVTADTITVHGVLQTELSYGESTENGKLPVQSAQEAIKALLSSPVKPATNGVTHNYTTRRRTGAYQNVKRPKKYMSDDLVDSDVLYNMTKQNLLPIVSKPFKTSEITTVRRSTATLPKISYIGLNNARQESVTAQDKVKTEPSTSMASKPNTHSGKPNNVTSDKLILEDSLVDVDAGESSFLKSILVPHGHNTRTKSGTAKMTEDVYNALRHLTGIDDDLSSYSNSACSDIDGEGTSPSGTLRRRGSYRTRKRLDLDKDPAVYPLQRSHDMKFPLPYTDTTSLLSMLKTEHSPQLPTPSSPPLPATVPNTCSCKFDNPNVTKSDSPRQSQVLKMLLTRDVLVEKDTACSCDVSNDTSSSAAQNVKNSIVSSIEAAGTSGHSSPAPTPETQEKSVSESSSKSPMMASLLLTQMAKAVQKTNEREYVPGNTTPDVPNGTKNNCGLISDKKYTDQPIMESEASSVLRLLLMTSKPETRPTPKKQYRRRRAPRIKLYEDRSASSSPEPSTLQSLLLQKTDYLGERRKRPYKRPTKETLVNRSSIYIDNAESGDSSIHTTRQKDQSAMSKSLPLLNSILGKHRGHTNPAHSSFYHMADDHIPHIKSEPIDYSNYGSRAQRQEDYMEPFRVKSEPEEVVYDLSLSDSLATSTSWGCVRVTTEKPQVTIYYLLSSMRTLVVYGFSLVF